MTKYILAIDQGTTSSRAILFQKNGHIFASAHQEFSQYYPNPGEVEHDALEIWQSVLTVVTEVCQKGKISLNQIEGIGITNQRETTVVWHRDTGKPIYNAIVWQDRRTSSVIDDLKGRNLQKEVKSRSGLLLDAYFSASKVQWILDMVEGARELASQGKLAFGTIDSWLIWNLTGGKTHVTDVSNASRTLLLNVNKVKWDVLLAELFDIPMSILPQLCDSSGIIAYTDGDIFGAEIPIAGVAGDQQAATFGHTGFHPGIAKNTYGTGCFLISPTGKNLVPSEKSLLSTICWSLHGEITYGLEGSILSAGAAITWLRDGLGIIDKASDISSLAESVADTGDVYFVPALAGLGSPYWDQYARGAIVGISRATTKAHIARATLEGIAFQVCDVVRSLEQDSGQSLQLLKVDGGATQSNFLLQFQADLLGIPVERPTEIELTARGVAYFAGLGTGFWRDLDEIQQLETKSTIFEPKIKDSQRKLLYERWLDAVGRCGDWASRSFSL
ncbi:MAG: glycerol kinase GlpK [Cyanobacterium sp. T60_A2020_053]|nr:glycerol kinase GlpK [Cyanobacterium sp. T60_A2020_053]